MQTEVIMAGFGGQGLMLIGKLLAKAGLDEGKEVTWLPSYGPEMRGGTANCTVVVSDKPIGSPLIPAPKGAIVMNRPSHDKFAPLVRPKGVLVVNSSLIPDTTPRSDLTVFRIPANEIAMEEGSGRGRLEPEISSSFGGLSCDTSLCTQCLSCLNECRQEALKAHEDSFVLSFKPVLCVQCGLCTATCPEDALSLEPGLVLQETFFRRDVLLEAEPARCRNCGKVFGTRKSLEKVKAILSVRQDLDMELFELCDRCRVKRFFEQEGEG